MGGGNCIRNSVQYLVERERLRVFPIKLPESLEVDLGEIFCFAQIEDPKKRKSLIISLLKGKRGQSLISDYDFICYIISRGYIDSANYILIILITNQALTPILVFID